MGALARSSKEGADSPPFPLRLLATSVPVSLLAQASNPLPAVLCLHLRPAERHWPRVPSLFTESFPYGNYLAWVSNQRALPYLYPPSLRAFGLKVVTPQWPRPRGAAARNVVLVCQAVADRPVRTNRLARARTQQRQRPVAVRCGGAVAVGKRDPLASAPEPNPG